MGRGRILIPSVASSGRRLLFRGRQRLEVDDLRKDVSRLVESLATGELDREQTGRLRSYLYLHYHPERRLHPRVRIYQAVKETLESENLNHLRDIAGIRERSAYINAISNVGKRSSYFGGLIGVTVVGFFLLPPIVKLGIVPVAKRAVRRIVPRQNYLNPIDKGLKLNALLGREPGAVFQGLRKALGLHFVSSAGKPVPARIDTAPMDDLIGNLFFCSLIESAGFDEGAQIEFRQRAQIAFLYDMARVSRQMEGLTRNPNLCWERIYHYTNFAMFLKSMESGEVPIAGMLRDAVETISRASIGSRKRDCRFYAEFERGLRCLHQALQVVEPLDRFNEADAFDDVESPEAKLAFFEQNRLVMERLYCGFENELIGVRPMFEEFRKAAARTPSAKARSEVEQYQEYQMRFQGIIGAHRKPLKKLGHTELAAYDAETKRLRSK